MQTKILIVFSCWLIGLNYSHATELDDSLVVFLDNNPYAIEVNMLTEGTKVFICADDDNLFARISVGNPMLFMRMLMQGLTIYIDPTGKKKEKFAVFFPSAKDVQNVMNNYQPIQNAQMSNEEKPDIVPLITEMNKKGVVFDVNGKSCILHTNRYFIALNPENETVDYYVLTPIKQMMQEKKLSDMWSFGIYVDTPSPEAEGPKMLDEPNTRQKQEINSFPDRQRKSDKDINKIMKSKINSWIKFSIEDAFNINLK